MAGPPRRYAVIGAGAVGGFYGARLAAAGHDVHFVARSDADHLRRHGLRVESPDGDIDLQEVAVARRLADLPPVDVVVLAVKTTDSGPVLRELAGAAIGDATVVVMQNGLGVEGAVAEAVGPGVPVLGAMCFVCCNKVGPGHVRHLDYSAVTLGQHTPDGRGAGITTPVDDVASDLEAAGIPVQRVENLATGRWRKLVWNIPYNGLSVVLDAGTDELMADPAARALVEDLMWEVVEAGSVLGADLDGEYVEYMLRTTDAMTPYATSMKLDFDAGRPLELEAIYATPIDVARDAGYEMVHTATLLSQLRFLDARRRR